MMEKKILDIEYEGIDSFEEGKAVIKQNGNWGILEDGEFKQGTEGYIFKSPDREPILKICKGQQEDCTLQEILKTIYQNIIYPKEAIEKEVEGTIVLELKIDESGRLVDVTAIRKIGAGCEEEGVRIVKEYLNDWIPGEQSGEFVKTRKFIPIKYKLK